MFENLKAFLKANRFIFTSFNEYKKFSTKSEKAFDIYFPILISVILTGVCFLLFNTSITFFIENVKNLNNVVITSISILAGFNVASISVIATSQSDIVKNLKSKPSDTDPNTNKFSIIIIFFTWAIVVQLIIIFLGILLHFVSQFYVVESFKCTQTPLWLWILLAIWLSAILHTITVSVRNVKMLYLFIVKDQ